MVSFRGEPLQSTTLATHAGFVIVITISTGQIPDHVRNDRDIFPEDLYATCFMTPLICAEGGKDELEICY
jgi:hypothetical protein